MKKIDLNEHEKIKLSDPETLDELRALYAYIEELLRNDRDVFYYNVFACISRVNTNFLFHYDKTEEEVNSLIESEGYAECKDPYVSFIREVTKDGNCFSDYYSEKIYEVMGIEKEEAGRDISRFVTLLDLYSVQSEGQHETVFKIAGKDIPCRWANLRFIEFDKRAWERIYAHYLERWSPEAMKRKSVKYYPEYTAADKMLAYYYLDFCYER